MRQSLKEGWEKVGSDDKAGHVAPPGRGSGAECRTCCLVEQALLR